MTNKPTIPARATLDKMLNLAANTLPAPGTKPWTPLPPAVPLGVPAVPDELVPTIGIVALPPDDGAGAGGKEAAVPAGTLATIVLSTGAGAELYTGAESVEAGGGVLPDGTWPVEISPGERFAGASFAREANVSMVRDWLFLGLEHGLLACGSKKSSRRCCYAGNIRINHADHLFLTMIALAAIVPDGLRVIDNNHERWHHGVSGLDGHETTENSWLLGRDIGKRDAWLVKARLDD